MYLIFIRRFPDLDHFFPIIYKLAKSDKAPISILCQNLDYNIQDDFILNFLKKEYDIDAAYSYHIDESALRRFSSTFLLSIRRIYPKIGVRVFNTFHRFLYGKKWAERLLDHFKPSALIMDFDRITKYSTKVLSEAAKEKRIPLVLMTHGVTMRLSGLQKHIDLPIADYKVFPNKLKVDYYKMNNDSDQTIKILGSPRYCDEWERIYNRILAKSFSCPDLPNENGKLNVLFFERPVIGLNSGHDSYKVIKNLDFVNAVFKERLEKKNPYHKAHGADYPSARLIQWADVVVMSISSIALEVLWQNKPLLFLKYLSPPGEVCAFDEYKACWPINNQSELIDAVKILKKDLSYRPYTEKNVDTLFCDIVYTGDKAKDILLNHIEFIKDIKSRKG